MDFPVCRYGLNFRLVTEDDAEFIVRLRTDKKLARYISHTDNSVANQVNWIKNYKRREEEGKEYYVLFEDAQTGPLGVFRLYKIEGDHFTAGSWLVKPDSEEFAALKSDLFLLIFGFEDLKMNRCFIDVRKDNKKLVRYHKMFFRLIGEDENNLYLDMDKAAYEHKRKYLTSILNL
jgi:hypothetical protein